MIEYDINENGATIHEPEPALVQYPYEDENGVKHDDLICHYAPNDKQVICAETGAVYDKAVDVYPCELHYYELEEYDDDLQHEVEENQGTD